MNMLGRRTRQLLDAPFEAAVGAQAPGAECAGACRLREEQVPAVCAVCCMSCTRPSLWPTPFPLPRSLPYSHTPSHVHAQRTSGSQAIPAESLPARHSALRLPRLRFPAESVEHEGRSVCEVCVGCASSCTGSGAGSSKTSADERPIRSLHATCMLSILAY